jgi:hypothetical protein
LRSDQVRSNELMLTTDLRAVGDEVQQRRHIDYVASHAGT